jgi:hypothetical protein
VCTATLTWFKSYSTMYFRQRRMCATSQIVSHGPSRETKQRREGSVHNRRIKYPSCNQRLKRRARGAGHPFFVCGESLGRPPHPMLRGGCANPVWRNLVYPSPRPWCRQLLRIGGPPYRLNFTLEGAPSKLRFGGAFVFGAGSPLTTRATLNHTQNGVPHSFRVLCGKGGRREWRGGHTGQ